MTRRVGCKQMRFGPWWRRRLPARTPGPALLLALFAGLATLHTWPLAADPAHLSRLDNDDTAFNAWVVAWVAHQLPRDPRRLFDAPIFLPERDTLAYSEHMFAQGLLGAPLLWAGATPILTYNVLVWAGFTLSGFAMCALMRRWTGSTAAGVIAGSLYAFNSHLLTRFSHLQALHLEFLPVALYAFDRVLRGPSRRDATLLASAFILQALCSNYTMVLLAVALLVSLAVRREPWRMDNRRLWLALGGAGAAVVAALVPFLLPYARVRAEQGLVRSVDEVAFYSAAWADYLTTASRVYVGLSREVFYSGRTSLFPGVTGLALALVAVAAGIAWRDGRARMALAFGLTGLALSFGAALPGYGWLHEHVPLLQGLRAAARWGFLLVVAVAILAGFGVAWMAARWRQRPWWPALAAGLLGLVTVEALRAPLTLSPVARISPVHARLASDTVTGIVVYPLYGRGVFNLNARYLLDQTRHWRPMVNGYSSFAPERFYERVERLQQFPAPDVLAELRAIGVSHVVLHRAPLETAVGPERLAELRAHPELEFVVEQDGVIVYRIRQ